MNITTGEATRLISGVPTERQCVETWKIARPVDLAQQFSALVDTMIAKPSGPRQIRFVPLGMPLEPIWGVSPLLDIWRELDAFGACGAYP